MKIFVTGGAGFIGSHLVDALVKEGHEVHIIDNFISGKKDYINPLAILHEVDIRSTAAKKLIIEEQPSILYHLAAQADVSLSIENPTYDSDVNINGTINLLEACKEAKVHKIIFSSTSAVYGNVNKPIIEEADLTNPSSYYGLSKCSAEKYIQLYQELYGLSYSILRYGNVYGPRQTPKGEGGVIAVFLDKLKTNTPFNIHGDGEQSRDFIYVKDVVSANMAAAKTSDSGIVNISTGRNTSINELITTFKSLHSETIKTNHTVARVGDIKHSCLKNEQANLQLNWNPQFNIFSGLKETYDYTIAKVD
ncbi:NAD-dependent epimerase/dehydratase family protein [Bacillus sp. B1-b2]|uniref:NAD-dependent epimerase/dehydratase family protein n=1 Tax=Bacillus sp. B1-b2 TaxID=2653201 RepID=UPI0012628696|nr:NAD-dependent epimerase/dehydratase family protein [Bacillus sp. B1-b2]KAB7671187.1 NAD-dependent epimerase/dehydratase family protein [Bacillus sp. B1-b2]